MNLNILFVRFSGFSLIGVANTLLSMLLIWLLNECLNVHYLASYVFAYVLTVLLAYVANARYVYGAKLSLRAGLKFFGAYLSGMVVGFAALRALAWAFPAASETLLSYVVIPITVIWNFLFANRVLSGKEHINAR